MKIDPDTLGILSALDYPTPTQVRITERLDRKAYEKTNKVLEALGGSWSRKAKAHVFDADAAARIDHAITTGEIETGQDVGHFPTPPELAAELVELADVRPGMAVLEPSAGTGAIVRAALAVPGVLVWAVERDAGRRRDLQLLERVEVLAVDDFLDLPCEQVPQLARVDRVVMNPPFCQVGKGDHLDHVMHAFGMLGREGLLVAVLPQSVVFRRDRRYREFREWYEDIDGQIAELPEGSFKASGTAVRTVTLRVGR